MNISELCSTFGAIVTAAAEFFFFKSACKLDKMCVLYFLKILNTSMTTVYMFCIFLNNNAYFYENYYYQ